MANGFDCATKLTAATAKTLKNTGFDYVGRYLGTSWKSFDAAEAKAIQDAGIKLISVFEKSSTSPGYFTKAQGIADAKEAMQNAKSVNQPVGSAIYFTVDYNAQPAHMGAIGDYLDGVKQTLQGYKVGLYGNYNTVMGQKGKVDFYWQTYAWSNGQVADHIHIHQYQNDITVQGVAIDRNDIKQDPGHWETPKPVSNDDYLYVVKSGDTLSGIAAAKGLTVDYLAKLNNLADPNKLSIGQRLKLKGSIPQPTVTIKTYAIKPGDNFWNLENKFNLKHGALVNLNPKVNPNTLQISQIIRIQ